MELLFVNMLFHLYKETGGLLFAEQLSVNGRPSITDNVFFTYTYAPDDVFTAISGGPGGSEINISLYKYTYVSKVLKTRFI